VCPFGDKSGVSAGDVPLVEETGRGVRCMVKSEPADASIGAEEVPDMISIALMTDLCSFVETMGCKACVVCTGYGAVTGGVFGRL
jgi:hypothetical protein